MQVAEQIIETVKKGYRLEFRLGIDDCVGLVVLDNRNRIVAGYAATDETELLEAVEEA